MRASDHRLFLYQLLRAPLRTGAIVPSGGPLARAMAAQIDPRGGSVVELGAGTGAITKALLDAGLPPEHLIAVERNPAFCRLLLERFPGIRVYQADACRIHELLKHTSSPRIQAVISGLPLLAMPIALQRRILHSSLAVLGPTGAFIQFTYGLASPVPSGLSEGLNLRGKRVRTVWRNVPPARIWCYKPRAYQSRVLEPLAA